MKKVDNRKEEGTENKNFTNMWKIEGERQEKKGEVETF